MTVAELISSSYAARENCKASGNAEWWARWDALLDAAAELLPSGGGFDDGTMIVRATDREIVLQTAFHHMDEHGGYDGWTEHTVKARATFGGLDIIVSGRNRNDIKDYIVEVFNHVLAGRVCYDAEGNIYPVD